MKDALAEIGPCFESGGECGNWYIADEIVVAVDIVVVVAIRGGIVRNVIEDDVVTAMMILQYLLDLMLLLPALIIFILSLSPLSGRS